MPKPARIADDVSQPVNAAAPPSAPPAVPSSGEGEHPAYPIADGVTIKRQDHYDFQFDNVDRLIRASTARLTLGLSPHAMGAAWYDWWLHLSRSPGRMLDLSVAGLENQMQLAGFMMGCLTGSAHEKPYTARPGDHRFDDAAWQQMPSCMLVQQYLALEAWWALATTKTPGMSREHADRVAFMVTQLLDVLSPTNSALTNPVIAQRTAAEGGGNLWRGFINLLEDMGRELTGDQPRSTSELRVGRDLGLTPGTVVYRNHLFELIQYTPTTASVHREPVLIIPAWIMKYYILDLTPKTSLVRYLLEQGHTVLMVSWFNPTPNDRDVSLDDYRRAVMEAIDAVASGFPDTRIHLTGYCLGGTISSIAAATMARDGDERLASLTLLAAQTDFSEAGELMLFVDESQITSLEDMMWAQGMLSGPQMSGAFQLLRSNELVWSRIIREYVLGDRGPVFPMQAWSDDLTRMPYKMHSQYLRGLFLENRLTAGRFAVEGRPIALKDIEVPMFVVGTESDHIAPWRSVYKAHLFTDNEMTFALTNAGHNAGIVSEPGHKRRHYRIGVRRPKDLYRDPDTWAAEAETREGSWWLAWAEWLATRSTGKVAARDDHVQSGRLVPMGAAPGTYVMQR